MDHTEELAKKSAVIVPPAKTDVKLRVTLRKFVKKILDFGLLSHKLTPLTKSPFSGILLRCLTSWGALRTGIMENPARFLLASRLFLKRKELLKMDEMRRAGGERRRGVANPTVSRSDAEARAGRHFQTFLVRLEGERGNRLMQTRLRLSSHRSLLWLDTVSTHCPISLSPTFQGACQDRIANL